MLEYGVPEYDVSEYDVLECDVLECQDDVNREPRNSGQNR